MLIRFINFWFGRQATWRLGRALYMTARGDVVNDISTNGELMVQQSVVDSRKSIVSSENLVVFDVGTNIGDWSEPLLEYLTTLPEHTSCDLHMFEPIPETMATLQGRLRNNSKRITLRYHQLALSSAEGAEDMYLLGASGINSLHPETSTDKASSISINKDTASQFCLRNGIDEIHLLKCDTEGHDMDVIEGALPLLERGRIKVLQFEYNHRWVYSRHYLKDVFDAVVSLPYRIGKIQPDHIELYPEWHPELDRFFEANYILVHQDVLSWFKTCETRIDEHNTLVII